MRLTFLKGLNIHSPGYSTQKSYRFLLYLVAFLSISQKITLFNSALLTGDLDFLKIRPDWKRVNLGEMDNC